jgi:hypothetical protein
MGGIILAGSPFAILQSIGALGLGAIFAPVAGTILVGGLIVIGIIAAVKALS